AVASFTSFPTRRSSDLFEARFRDGALFFRVDFIDSYFATAALERDHFSIGRKLGRIVARPVASNLCFAVGGKVVQKQMARSIARSEEHTSELQSPYDLV